MRRLLLLAFVVPAVAGCGGSTKGLANEGGGPGRDVPRWALDENLPLRAIPGARIYASAGCGACHTYAGTGQRAPGAPDLTAIGLRNLGVATQIKHLKDPNSVSPGSQMPQYASMGAKRLGQLAIFLEASKGTH